MSHSARQLNLIDPSATLDERCFDYLTQIERLDASLLTRFRDRLHVEPALNRSLVSFQANKSRAVYRWYKFKEGFAASLVEYLFDRYRAAGKVLDPFAGSGTTLFTASSLGLEAVGIELLPIGQQIIETKMMLDAEFTAEDLRQIERWLQTCPWAAEDTAAAFTELRITAGAYPSETKEGIQRYLQALNSENPRVQMLLRFVLLCVLESISYTRKDGQYLRWDERSGRRQGKRRFNKGPILPFDLAIRQKLSEVLDDLEPARGLLFSFTDVPGAPIQLLRGSCLHVLPTLKPATFDAIMTSPPYCNRYDYTRTYALELAMLGVDERELVALRQAMLSCTVENRAKDLVGMNPRWMKPIALAERHELLAAILAYLEHLKSTDQINNTGIPRMVRGYFYEMACVLVMFARVAARGTFLHGQR